MRLALVRAAENEVGHAATRALVGMALTARDVPNARGDPPNLYFGGRVRIALFLGYHPDEADTPAAHQAVKRAINELVTKQLTELRRAAVNGRNAVYDLSILREESR